LKLCTKRVNNDECKASCPYCKKSVLAENYLEHAGSPAQIPSKDRTIINEILKNTEKYINLAKEEKKIRQKY